MPIPDIIGLFGVAAFVAAYALLQLGKLTSGENWYLLLNGLGAALVLVSLFYSFNLPSFVTQTLWLIFTAIGFFRGRCQKAKATEPRR